MLGFGESLLIDKTILLLINFVSIWLIIVVYFANPKNKVNRLFCIMTIFLAFWLNGGYLFSFSNNLNSALFLGRLILGEASISLTLIYFFAIFFPREIKRNIIFEKVIFVFAVIFFVVPIFTDLIVSSVEFTEYGVNPIFGPGQIFYYAWIGFLFFLIISQIFKKYTEVSKTEKIKVKYFFLGFSIFVLMNIFFNIILPFLQGSIKYWQFGNYSAIFLFGFTAYAITKHELLGIKTLVTQILIAAISIILLIDLFVLSDNITMQLLKSGILAAFLYFSRGMVESVKKEKRAREKLEDTYKKIDQYVVKLEEGNKDFKALLDADSVIAGSLDSEKIAQDIVDSIPKSLKHLSYKGGVLVRYSPESNCVYGYSTTETKIIKKAKKFLNKPLRQHSENINNIDNLIVKTIKTRKIQISDKFENFVYPIVSKNVCKLLHKVVGAKSFISIPILSGRKVVGVIIFLGMKPQKEITQRDKNVLSGFSSHIGSAIENAELYKKTNVQMKELEKLNKNLKEANQKLEELIEMKNEFLHITSHQLRTPLTAIRGMISLWYEGSFDNLSKQKRRKVLKNIYVSAERLNNITNDMLDSLELEGGVFKFQFKQVSLKKVIEESISLLEFDYDKKGLYINFNVESKDIFMIEAEPSYVRQIFMNLIDNACKYTNKGGVDIDIEKSGKYVVVTIKDTGIGLSKKDQKIIFQKFTRSEEAIVKNAAGSGLGLFIARKIVKAHHGKIKFYSGGKGKGSTVKVHLPIEQE